MMLRDVLPSIVCHAFAPRRISCEIEFAKPQRETGELATATRRDGEKLNIRPIGTGTWILRNVTYVEL